MKQCKLISALLLLLLLVGCGDEGQVMDGDGMFPEVSDIDGGMTKLMIYYGEHGWTYDDKKK